MQHPAPIRILQRPSTFDQSTALPNANSITNWYPAPSTAELGFEYQGVGVGDDSVNYVSFSNRNTDCSGSESEPTSFTNTYNNSIPQTGNWSGPAQAQSSSYTTEPAASAEFLNPPIWRDFGGSVYSFPFPGPVPASFPVQPQPQLQAYKPNCDIQCSNSYQGTQQPVSYSYVGVGTPVNYTAPPQLPVLHTLNVNPTNPVNPCPHCSPQLEHHHQHQLQYQNQQPQYLPQQQLVPVVQPNFQFSSPSSASAALNTELVFYPKENAYYSVQSQDQEAFHHPTREQHRPDCTIHNNNAGVSGTLPPLPPPLYAVNNNAAPITSVRPQLIQSQNPVNAGAGGPWGTFSDGGGNGGVFTNSPIPVLPNPAPNPDYFGMSIAPYEQLEYRNVHLNQHVQHEHQQQLVTQSMFVNVNKNENRNPYQQQQPTYLPPSNYNYQAVYPDHQNPNYNYMEQMHGETRTLGTEQFVIANPESAGGSQKYVFEIPNHTHGSENSAMEMDQAAYSHDYNHFDMRNQNQSCSSVGSVNYAQNHHHHHQFKQEMDTGSGPGSCREEPVGFSEFGTEAETEDASYPGINVVPYQHQHPLQVYATPAGQSSDNNWDYNNWTDVNNNNDYYDDSKDAPLQSKVTTRMDIGSGDHFRYNLEVTPFIPVSVSANANSKRINDSQTRNSTEEAERAPLVTSVLEFSTESVTEPCAPTPNPNLVIPSNYLEDGEEEEEEEEEDPVFDDALELPSVIKRPEKITQNQTPKSTTAKDFQPIMATINIQASSSSSSTSTSSYSSDNSGKINFAFAIESCKETGMLNVPQALRQDGSQSQPVKKKFSAAALLRQKILESMKDEPPLSTSSKTLPSKSKATGEAMKPKIKSPAEMIAELNIEEEEFTISHFTPKVPYFERYMTPKPLPPVTDMDEVDFEASPASPWLKKLLKKDVKVREVPAQTKYHITSTSPSACESQTASKVDSSGRRSV